jgi:hypothetical protein
MLGVYDIAKNLLERGEATPVLYTADAVGNPPSATVPPSVSFGSPGGGSMRLVVILLAILIAISLFRR